MQHDPSEWRHPTERDELVERLIASERHCRLLERALREYAEVKDQDPSVGSYVVALLARIEGLEKNLQRLVDQRRGPDNRRRIA